ncbi:heparinase II/III family protein [Pseudoalteromonas sp. SG43-5]|uniref:heparinase II/III domain-containing protein n=1 Tax=Pseudoalteromonas sp. SG43-5 TaxID=2760968 RepID=UPI0016012057|nr:heparinase II/III family protein [Pseudoalteromonas sp. SG43-5]MBB1455699.1 heparinase II/III family protein [Pseudoalteromonas sp. SG43-5]
MSVITSKIKREIPLHKFLRSSVVATCFGFIITLIAFKASATEVERPSIWVKKSERPEILNKIQTEPWAKSLFEELQQRVKPIAAINKEQRLKPLAELPLIWNKDKSQAPTLPHFRVKGGGSKEQLISVVKALQDGVDCGVMYFLTQEDKYAACGADILNTYSNALIQMKVHKEGAMNSSWMFPGDHLYEARVIGAQLPIIYDLVYPYLKSGGKVYDLQSNSLVAFDFDQAQQVFKTYIWLALNKGLLDSNWPVLESSSLVHNILALNDPEEIAKYLPYYTDLDTKHQASLKTVAKKFENEGDIWPESFQYSKHVAAFSVYLMTLLDRYDPTLKLGQKYTNIPAAFTSYYDLQYPNNEYPYIGDGHRTYKPEYSAFEMSLLLAKLNNNEKQIDDFSNYLASSISAGAYQRGHLHDRSDEPSPYFTPLQLLWSVKEIQSTQKVDVAPPRPRTKRLEYAGMNIQRNVSKQNPVKNSLMAFVAGGSYIHGHASGMDMELYGQGHVLGIDGGKGTYRTPIHENYYRLFAAHNSVISNGASASSGDWINLGINRVQSIAMEPAAGETGVSDKYSFNISSFYDEFNKVTPANHQRTLALIKLSDTKGYYLDIFRAKSDYEQEFHDYVYHNIGDKVDITTNSKKVKLKADAQRYQAAAKTPWVKHKYYQHPGWHYFEDVKTASVSSQQFEATFTASKLGDKSIAMRALIPAGLDIELTTVNAPKAYGASAPYNKKPLPTFLMRHQGETWSNPFTVAYESVTEGEDYALTAIERLYEKDLFKGVKVSATVDGKSLTQYIIVQENSNDKYEDKELGIYFEGQFAVITADEQNKLVDMYIGKGTNLQFKKQTLTTFYKNSAYMKM